MPADDMAGSTAKQGALAACSRWCDGRPIIDDLLAPHLRNFIGLLHPLNRVFESVPDIVLDHLLRHDLLHLRSFHEQLHLLNLSFRDRAETDIWHTPHDRHMHLRYLVAFLAAPHAPPPFLLRSLAGSQR